MNVIPINDFVINVEVVVVLVVVVFIIQQFILKFGIEKYSPNIMSMIVMILSSNFSSISTMSTHGVLILWSMGRYCFPHGEKPTNTIENMIFKFFLIFSITQT